MHLRGIAESLETFGARFLERIFTPREIAFARAGGADQVGRLAECFAAKEAAFKAMGRPDAPLVWRDVEIRREADGARVTAKGGVSLPVVFSRRDGCAMALVIGHD